MARPISRQLRLWRRRIRARLCGQCGAEPVLKGMQRGPRCVLLQRRYFSDCRRHGAWKPGGPGRPPRYTDVELRKLVGARRARS